MTPLKLLISILLTLTLCGAVRTRSRANYGEFCDNRTVRCDSSLSLTCQDEKCVCMKADSMIYDPSRGGCTALAGEKCKYTVLEEYRSWQEEILCVTHAHCDFQRNICVCNRDFLELANGTCIPKKGYNEPCETTSDCKQEYSMICKDSKCTCNSEIAEYSEELNQCVGLASKRCINDLCTLNAICREETPRRVYYSSSGEVDSNEYSEDGPQDPASVGRCQCRTAFGVTPEGRCRLGFGGKCNHEEAKCMDWLKCREGTCTCKYPRHQVFNKSLETCLSLVRGPCTGPSTSNDTTASLKAECIQGTVCTKEPGSHKYRCACPEGFIENGDRSCDLAYGQKCKTQLGSGSFSSRQAWTTPNMRCDAIGKLACIDGRCQCEDPLHAYDVTSRSCKGLVGALCNIKDSEDCMAGTSCKVRRGGAPEGFCQCLEYYKENEDGTCSIALQNEVPTSPSTLSLKSGDNEVETDEGWDITQVRRVLEFLKKRQEE